MILTTLNHPIFVILYPLSKLIKFINSSFVIIAYVMNVVFCCLTQHHSAYIEVAEMLVDKDPLGAVDVYCRFPTAAVPTFDDAYIFGEIVRILFKLEAYDDPRMLSNMIAMGKVMGFGMTTFILQYRSFIRYCREGRGPCSLLSTLCRSNALYSPGEEGNWSQVSYRSSVGQGKFDDQRPTFYHGAMSPCYKLNVYPFCYMERSIPVALTRQAVF